MRVSDPIATLPKTAPRTIFALKRVGINSLWDLINYFPTRHENLQEVDRIGFLKIGKKVTIKGEISDVKAAFTKRGFRMQTAKLTDSSGHIKLIWFNQPYLLSILSRTRYLSVSGILKMFGAQPAFHPEQYELLETPESLTLHTGRLVPIYRKVQGTSTRTLREKIHIVVTSLKKHPNKKSRIPEFIPETIIKQHKLMGEFQAYCDIHFPENETDKERALERLAFDEMFVIQLSSKLKKKDWNRQIVVNRIHITEARRKKLSTFISCLPFRLTAAQERSIREIVDDLSRLTPMNRLLQGDVGSGKTVVAAAAAVVVAHAGFKTLIMAPTEILAAQHFNTLLKLRKSKRVAFFRPVLVTSTIKPKPLELDTADVLVGTHALLFSKHVSPDVGLVVIDEQHKFGVKQRKALAKGAGHPHTLSMTATPIPRTVALTLYGELDISTIDTLPEGRSPAVTYLVPPRKRDDGYQWIAQKIASENTQVFIVCPLIDESDSETMKNVKSAKDELSKLERGPLKKARIGLLHGRLKPTEKSRIMKGFADAKLDVLVSTPVVEVGIDIPNATIIAVETPERFGLSQLHQLRGRVGRGDSRGICLLFLSESDEEIKKRLSIFAKVNDGFRLAEEDLKLRGVGELYGTRQHGLGDLKVASLTDTKLIRKSSSATDFFMSSLIHNLPKYTDLQRRIKNHRKAQIGHN